MKNPYRLLMLTVFVGMSLIFWGCSSSESAVQGEGGEEAKTEKAVKEEKAAAKDEKAKEKKSAAKKEKEIKFESTGTSADNFLKAAFELGKTMRDFNRSYENTKLYVQLLLSNPTELIGKDVATVANAARDAGSIPANIQVSDLKGMIESKKDALKDIKDAAIKNSITELIQNAKTMITSLAEVPGKATTLVNEGTALPDKLKGELTGMKAPKLPGVLKRVTDASKDLTTIADEAPKMVTNLQEMLGLLEILSKEIL